MPSAWGPFTVSSPSFWEESEGEHWGMWPCTTSYVTPPPPPPPPPPPLALLLPSICKQHLQVFAADKMGAEGRLMSGRVTCLDGEGEVGGAAGETRGSLRRLLLSQSSRCSFFPNHHHHRHRRSLAGVLQTAPVALTPRLRFSHSSHCLNNIYRNQSLFSNACPVQQTIVRGRKGVLGLCSRNTAFGRRILSQIKRNNKNYYFRYIIGVLYKCIIYSRYICWEPAVLEIGFQLCSASPERAETKTERATHSSQDHVHAHGTLSSSMEVHVCACDRGAEKGWDWDVGDHSRSGSDWLSMTSLQSGTQTRDMQPLRDSSHHRSICYCRAPRRESA